MNKIKIILKKTKRKFKKKYKIRNKILLIIKYLKKGKINEKKK
jgi:hypothetical protein